MNGIGSDRVGLGWRPEIGRDIIENLDRIDVLEIVAENVADLPRRELRSFKRLAATRPVMVHGVGLGLASAYRPDERALANIARAVHIIEPEAWSEHLAFVRTPSYELGHLAAPPWNEEIVESAVRNIAEASRLIGSKPHLENIATLYHPPVSTLDEGEWTSRIIERSGCCLLLDVENVYANSRAFHLHALSYLDTFPLGSVSYIHIAGGREAHDEIGEYFLDDHNHAVSSEVYSLLEETASRTPSSLTVILERDGNYPPFEELLWDVELARAALARGRVRREGLRHAS